MLDAELQLAMDLLPPGWGGVWSCFVAGGGGGVVAARAGVRARWAGTLDPKDRSNSSCDLYTILPSLLEKLVTPSAPVRTVYEVPPT